MSGVEWAPNLPRGWDRASLRWLAEIYAGGTPNKEKLEFWTNGTIPWLNSGSVNDWSIKTPSALISSEGYSGSSAKWIPVGSVVIALAGQGKTKGMAARLEIDSTCNQSMAAIVPGRKLDYRFLHFWLAANYQNIRNMAGGDKRDGLNLVHIGSIEVPLPPLGEQQAIADYLDRETRRIDELIAEQRGLIETLRERRVSVVDQAVVGAMTAQRPLVQDTGFKWLGEIPRNWSVRPLWSMFERIKDVGHPEEVMLSVFRDYGVIKKDSRDNLNRTAENRNIYQMVDDGWFVVNRMKAWQGSVGVSSLRGILSGHYICFRPRHAESSAYLNWLFRSSRYKAGYQTISRGVRPGQAEIDNGDLRVLPVLVPPIEEQLEISAYLEDQTSRIDALIAESEDLIAFSQERRAALITEAVTGQIDVRTAA